MSSKKQLKTKRVMTSELISSMTNLVVSTPIPESVVLTKTKGDGAGGKNTNLYGKKFEELTNNEEQLFVKGYKKTLITSTKSKNGYYLSKTVADKEITFVIQGGLKLYMEKEYNIKLFRCPDEAYIVKRLNDPTRHVLKILEKKEQHVDGSVETKLWSGVALKREYELMCPDFEICYAFCLSSFLKDKFNSEDKKYKVLNQIFKENNIEVFFGEDADYFEKINEWIQK